MIALTAVREPGGRRADWDETGVGAVRWTMPGRVGFRRAWVASTVHGFRSSARSVDGRGPVLVPRLLRRRSHYEPGH